MTPLLLRRGGNPSGLNSASTTRRLQNLLKIVPAILVRSFQIMKLFIQVRLVILKLPAFRRQPIHDFLRRSHHEPIGLSATVSQSGSSLGFALTSCQRLRRCAFLVGELPLRWLLAAACGFLVLLLLVAFLRLGSADWRRWIFAQSQAGSAEASECDIFPCLRRYLPF